MQLTERAENRIPLGKHHPRILLQFTGIGVNTGSSLTHCEPNTFVKPAELAHMGKRGCAAAVSRPPTGTAATPRQTLQQWDVAHVS